MAKPPLEIWRQFRMRVIHLVTNWLLQSCNTNTWAVSNLENLNDSWLKKDFALSQNIYYLSGTFHKVIKGQKISKQNCWAVTSPKKWTDKFVFLSWGFGNTSWILISSFKYFREKQIHLFIFWEKLLLDNFFSRSTDL